MAKGDSKLHPTKGVNPHLTFCPNCGKDSGGIALMGINDKKFTCNPCQSVSFGATKCLKCGGHDGKIEALRETERVPDSDMCDACRTETQEHHVIVQQGGVFWRCTYCGRAGVIKPSPFAALVREKGWHSCSRPLRRRLQQERLPRVRAEGGR